MLMSLLGGQRMVGELAKKKHALSYKQQHLIYLKWLTKIKKYC